MKNCPNCQSPLSGNFCAQCGQKNRTFVRPFRKLVEDFLGDYFTFDTRLFRSLKPLIFKPGFLTLEYLQGRRISYIPPLRMYLFASVLFFFLISLGNYQPQFARNIETTPVPPADSLVVDSLSADTLQQQTDVFLPDSADIAKNDDFSDEFRRWLFKRLQKLDGNMAPINAAALHNIPNMMFLLLPVFALLLGLIYRRSGRFYIEHLIFSVHIHVFAFLLLSVVLLSAYLLLLEDVEFVRQMLQVTILPVMIYSFLAMRRFYGQSNLKTFLKFLLLYLGYVVIFLSLMIGNLLWVLWRL